MVYRKLKLNAISAQGLGLEMDLYCKASIVGYPKSMQKTFINTKPTCLEFIVDESYLTKPGLVLLFQLKKYRYFLLGKEIGSIAMPLEQLDFLTDKEIGFISIPVEQLFQENSERIVQHQVLSKSGKVTGFLKFAYNFDEKFSQPGVYIDYEKLEELEKKREGKSATIALGLTLLTFLGGVIYLVAVYIHSEGFIVLE